MRTRLRIVFRIKVLLDFTRDNALEEGQLRKLLSDNQGFNAFLKITHGVVWPSIDFSNDQR